MFRTASCILRAVSQSVKYNPMKFSHSHAPVRSLPLPKRDLIFGAARNLFSSGVFAPRETHARDDVGSHDHDHIFTKAEIPHSPVIAKRGHHAALRVELCSAPHLTARGF